MENFNHFQNIVDSARAFGKRRRYTLLAVEGTEAFCSDRTKYRGIEVIFEKLSDRKLESDRMTKMKVLIYDSVSESLDWKSVYRNSKGIYFKKDTKYYL